MDRWCDVVGWEGVYSVSDVGRVRYEEDRGGRFFTRKGDIVAQARDLDDYAIVPLVRLGDRKNRRPYRVARLVAAAFLGPAPFPQAQVNHKNGCRADDAVENLEWVSALDNIRHAVTVLGRDYRGTKSKSSKLSEAQVVELRERAAAGEAFNALGAAFGVTNVCAAKIARGISYANAPGPLVAAR